MEKPALTFRVFRGKNLVRRETIRQDVVKIGKDPRSHLYVDCDLAGRMHAVVEAASPDDVTLIDLGNEPGTLVNGVRVNKCHLHAGDRIQIGTTTFELEGIAPAAPAPTPSSEPRKAPVPPAPAPRLAATFTVPLHNPFLAPPVALAAPQAAADGEYAMIKSGPEVHPEEVELDHVTAVEVIVKWGTNVLHVAHLSPVRSFFVGERGARKGEECDFLLPSDVLGAARAPVLLERDGSAWLVVPAGAKVATPDDARRSLADFVASGRARPSSEWSGAHEIELSPGERAVLTLPRSEVSFEVSVVNAGKRVAGAWLPALEASAYKQIGLSLALHLGIVASLALFMPRMSADDAESIDRDYMARMLHASDANAMIENPTEPQEAPANAGASGGDGQRAQGAEGRMGDKMSAAQNRHYSIAGPRDNPDPHLARERALWEATHEGMVGLLASMGGARNAPIAAWAEDTALGRDAANHLGAMWGAEAGEAWGPGGLGLLGDDEGGGGPGRGIGLDKIGTIGGGAGCIAAPGKPCGIGIGPGGEGVDHGYIAGRKHVPTAKAPREGDPKVNGQLPREVIQRIVRQNFGRFRNCYESSLRTNPSLQGRVAIKFVIGRDGSVSMAADGGSDLPDQAVIACVARGFQNLSFPSPQGGIVTVVYPIIFSPSE